MAFGPASATVISWLFYQSFLLVFRSLAYCGGVSAKVLFAGKANSSYLGSRNLGLSAFMGRAAPAPAPTCKPHYRWITIALIAATSVERRDKPADISPLPAANEITFSVYRHGDHVLGFVGIICYAFVV